MSLFEPVGNVGLSNSPNVVSPGKEMSNEDSGNADVYVEGPGGNWLLVCSNVFDDESRNRNPLFEAPTVGGKIVV